MCTNDGSSLSLNIFCFLGWKTEGPGCFLEVKQTEKGKHSWELGKGDPHVALKESQRAGSLWLLGSGGSR